MRKTLRSNSTPNSPYDDEELSNLQTDQSRVIEHNVLLSEIGPKIDLASYNYSHYLPTPLYKYEANSSLLTIKLANIRHGSFSSRFISFYLRNRSTTGRFRPALDVQPCRIRILHVDKSWGLESFRSRAFPEGKFISFVYSKNDWRADPLLCHDRTRSSLTCDQRSKKESPTHQDLTHKEIGLA